MKEKAIARQELAAEDELLALLNAPEIIKCQQSVFDRLRSLALNQQLVGKQNEELFREIQGRLDLLRQVWRERHLIVGQSIENSPPSWSKIISRGSEDFHYVLMIDGNPAISVARHDLYDGDVEALSLKIHTRTEYVSCFPELMEKTQWVRRIRYTFLTNSLVDPHVQTIELEFDETVVSQDGPESEDKIFTKGKKTLKPAVEVKAGEKFYYPEASETFRLAVTRSPSTRQLRETFFQSRPFLT